MSANFADSLRAIAVSWLQGPIANAFLTSSTEMINGLASWATEGVRARFPATAPPDALGYIGNDRDLERGPAQTDAGYRVQLRRAFDTWRVAGNASTVLRQLAAYFTGIATPPLRAVSDRGTWHEYNWITDVVTKTKVGTNWIWDGFTGTRWWRGWVIIDSSAGPWSSWKWGDGHKWGDPGLTWGSTASPNEITSLRAIIRKWRPANVGSMIIMTFDASLFERTDASPPNPNGDYDVIANRDPNAAYIPLEIF